MTNQQLTIKSQNFGIEIEMTGITRKQAAEAVAKLLGTSALYVGGTYGKWTVKDNQSRTWTLMSDGSIKKEKKTGRKQYELTTEYEYSVELVSPILKYTDIELLQDIVRVIRKAGAKVNSSCGIHVHVDGANHTSRSLRNILNIIASKEDLIYTALQVESSREENYCKKVRTAVLEKINKVKPSSIAAIGRIWYEEQGEDFNLAQHDHYNNTRYSALNLHAVWYKGTVEFRLFNSTLHAGEVKSYLQFALAISAQAITQKSASSKKTRSTNEKYTFRTWLLRLGLIGEEFETARGHLLKNLEGDVAWRHGNPLQQAAV